MWDWLSVLSTALSSHALPGTSVVRSGPGWRRGQWPGWRRHSGPATALYSPRRHMRGLAGTLEEGRHHGLDLGDGQPHQGIDKPDHQEDD